mmetsp:Transcript_92948/g.240096  ORF Transcript_92948/g.240096 Transcript_92948/m.240096 type:complete len:634 (-) Transcript_92948:176-2077(-)
MAAQERRVDPTDGVAYTWDELSAYYKGTYKKKALEAYWENECTPVKKGKKAKAKTKAEAEPKAKAKSKAKAKVKPNAKAKAEKGPANPKRFVNDTDKIVQDAVDGLVWSTPNLGRLDAYPDVKVVFRTDWNKDKVAVICGGGAGHEPMHGGFVGQGMLTAAISGETFASPSIDAVLMAIVHVTGPKGCLLVIKNYTGDRLNFTLAAQRARARFGLNVEIVITKDDVATVAERGIAGTLFVSKIAGAAAEEGKSLVEVKAIADAVIDATASMGVSFSAVRRLTTERIKLGKMEVGLGIHGEPGSKIEDKAPATRVVDTIMEGIMAAPRMQAEAPQGYACLVNNLGGVPPMEMTIIVAALMKSKWAEKVKLLIGPAALCTSLDMNGVSLSLIRLTDQLSQGLKAPTALAAWPKAVAPAFPEPAKALSLPDPLEGVAATSDSAVRGAIERACKALIGAKSELNTLDGKTGDADCGSTMETASTRLLAELDKLPLADAKATCECLSSILGKTMGGSSGVLLSIMFMGMTASFEKAGGKAWAEAGPQAFMDGLQAMMDAGGARTGSRTMLDALVPAAEALVAGKGLVGAKEAAEAGAKATGSMAPKAGRAENVPESAWRGVEDPGAKAASIAFAALAS